MTNENFNRIDLNTHRTPQKWQRLLDALMRNDANMSLVEQDYYVKEIRNKIFGRNDVKKEILEQIKAGAAEPPKFD